ncbi:YqaI family protein [Bacillus sp. AG4(2022)]|uniref:YqaI family protein n=1 Tax=Bacillus sp. AG4(2022) TaxID=2962594 RepID=UPI002882D305|nr:hypothetical protein [Bacillus sp. AG4(2022)]MDT0163849.1 hypothetical protein [Bacillus sp. AG4(2022)]
MADIQHPDITKAEKTGYANQVAQPKHCDIDYYGTEILAGDKIVVDSENGEIILEDSLEDYLLEVKGFQFKIAD